MRISDWSSDVCSSRSDDYRRRHARRICLRAHPSLGAVMPIVVDARHQRRQQWRRRTTPVQLATWFGWLVGVALFAYCFQLLSDRTLWAFVGDAPAQAGALLGRMVTPPSDRNGVV